MEMPPIRVSVTEYIREEKTCPTCGRKVTAAFPDEAAASQQYGCNRTRSLAKILF
jgi:transposase